MDDEQVDQVVVQIMVDAIHMTSNLTNVERLCTAMDEAARAITETGSGMTNADLTMASITLVAALVLDVPEPARVNAAEAMKVLLAQTLERIKVVSDSEKQAYHKGNWRPGEVAAAE